MRVSFEKTDRTCKSERDALWNTEPGDLSCPVRISADHTFPLIAALVSPNATASLVLAATEVLGAISVHLIPRKHVCGRRGHRRQGHDRDGGRRVDPAHTPAYFQVRLLPSPLPHRHVSFPACAIPLLPSPRSSPPHHMLTHFTQMSARVHTNQAPLPLPHPNPRFQ